ncbi:MAG: hypothetical protein ABI728_07735 [Betaproteobacteria bacterium]
MAIRKIVSPQLSSSSAPAHAADIVNDTLDAIAFFALLAFPDLPDWRDRFAKDCVVVICSEWAIGNKARKKALRFDTIERAREKRALYKSGPITKALNRIPKRLLVADAVIALMVNSMGDKLGFPVRVKLNGVVVKKISDVTAAIMNGVSTPHRRIESTKIHQRYLKPTKPVLHLAIALRAMLNEDGASPLKSGSDMFSLFLNPTWIGSTIRIAESLRMVLPAIPSLKLKPGQLAPLWQIKQKVAID